MLVPVDGKLPYEELTDPEDVHEQVVKGKTLEIPKTTPDAIVEIMTKCWETLPEFRPRFHEIVAFLQFVKQESAKSRRSSRK